MAQLATIFEKIKENFYHNFLEQGEKENHELIFSPFSTGFNYDDFLFLDSNKASENAHKYLDELYEFSQIANTIPRQDDFWTISGNQNDYLFNPYKTILQSLRLMDPDTLDITMLYDHPIFVKALHAINEDNRKVYQSFFDLRTKMVNEIQKLKESINDSNKTTVDLEIKLKENNLRNVEEEWNANGKKEEVENKIMAIIKDEFKRFLHKFDENKGQVESLQREHPGSGAGFYLTYCMPNNLYKGDELEWKKINIPKQEIKEILENTKSEKYHGIFGESDLSKLEMEAINFELMFVNVTRAWYDETILNSPFWDINILNKKEIEIPRVTRKLIFIRNIDVKLPSKSAKNEVLLQRTKATNIGPFVVRAAQLQPGKHMRLNSVNTALNLERKMVLNVGSKLNERRGRKKRSIQTLVAKKQQQFTRLAPRLKHKHKAPVKMTIQPDLKMVQPKLKRRIVSIQKVKSYFIFTDDENNEPVSIQPKDLKIFKRNKPVKIQLSNTSANKLKGIFTKNSLYEFTVNKEGYEPMKFSHKSRANKNTVVRKHIKLKKIKEVEETISESFQLIGVVAEKIKPFPKPIKKADYI